MLSFIIPAHNEETELGATLEALRMFAESSPRTCEIIVVDDASTDDTAAVARALGATTVPIALRHIAAARNAGAAAAHGDILIFVDADTIVPSATIRAALAALDDGAVAGGAKVRLDADSPLWSRVIWCIFMTIYTRMRLAAGCFLFVRRDAFESVGGFDERYFATEEIHLSRALKALGRFVIVAPAVTTSGRKFRARSAGVVFREIRTVAGKGWKPFRHRHDWWYGPQREPGSGLEGKRTAADPRPPKGRA